MRVSGGELTIGKPHLFQIPRRLEGKGYRFILKTNGIPIAYYENYAEEISKFDFVHVRVSLKGCNEEEFSMLTGAKPEGFKLQLKSLEKLVEANVSPDMAREVEIEELILYPHVINRIQKHRLKCYSAYTPEGIPWSRSKRNPHYS